MLHGFVALHSEFLFSLQDIVFAQRHQFNEILVHRVKSLFSSVDVDEKKETKPMKIRKREGKQLKVMEKKKELKEEKRKLKEDRRQKERKKTNEKLKWKKKKDSIRKKERVVIERNIEKEIKEW